MTLITILQLLNIVLLGGTLYSWYQFYKVLAKKCDTCSVDLHTSPFRSKCFVGALFFTASFALALYALNMAI